jgi:hypothetical protein
MSQVIPQEILTILAQRGQFRSTGTRSTFPEAANKLIEEIRKEIPSGQDGDGWYTVGANWRSNVKTSNFMPTMKSNEWERRTTTKPVSQGHGSYTPMDSSRVPRFVNKSAQQTAASLTAKPASTTSSVSAAPSVTPVQTVVTAATVTSAQTAQQPKQYPVHQKYVSKFKNTEEKLEDTIVNTIILNKLNKFSPANYEDVKEFLLEILSSGETEFLSDFMKLVFTKAAAEETFCPLYAKLLKELSAKFPFLLKEMDTLYHRFTDIFDEVNEKDCSNMEEFIKKNKEKKYRHGYSQFLAELLKNDVVDKTAFINTLNYVITQIGELGKEEDKSQVLDEYTGCLLKILTALKNHGPAKDIRDTIKESIKDKLAPYTIKSDKYPSITNKIRFAILDARDCLN